MLIQLLSVRAFRIALPMILLGALLQLQMLVAPAMAEEPFPIPTPDPTISVSGSAVVRVAPDEAVLTFSIASREEKLDASVTDNDKKVKAVTEFLLESGVKSSEIRTEVISIYPILQPDAIRPVYAGPFANGPSLPPLNANGLAPARPPANTPSGGKPLLEPVGYRATRQLSITISDLEAFEKIYRGMIERGVNVVGGVEFRTTELRQHKDKARLQAVKAAKEKAVAMAGELGASVTAVRSISENQPNYFGSALAQNSFSIASQPGSSTSVAAGMIEIKARVSVVFLLGDTKLTK